MAVSEYIFVEFPGGLTNLPEWRPLRCRIWELVVMAFSVRLDCELCVLLCSMYFREYSSDHFTLWQYGLTLKDQETSYVDSCCLKDSVMLRRW